MMSTSYLILVRIAHDVEEKIDIVAIDNGPIVQKDYVTCILMCLSEERLLERFLFLQRRKYLIVILQRTEKHRHVSIEMPVRLTLERIRLPSLSRMMIPLTTYSEGIYER